MREYKIIAADSAGLLVEQVNKEIQNGYEPIGGIAIGENRIYHQAILGPKGSLKRDKKVEKQKPSTKIITGKNLPSKHSY